MCEINLMCSTSKQSFRSTTGDLEVTSGVERARELSPGLWVDRVWQEEKIAIFATTEGPSVGGFADKISLCFGAR